MEAGQHWEVQVPISVKDIGDYAIALRPCFASLRRGDFVRITGFERVGGDAYGRAIETLEVIVSARDEGRNLLEVVPTGEINVLPRYAPPGAGEARTPGELRVVRSGAAYDVQDVLGNSIDLFVEKSQAVEFADRENARLGSPSMKSPVVLENGKSVKRGFGCYEIWEDGKAINTFKTKAEAEASLAA
jgi:hypothetical protein